MSAKQVSGHDFSRAEPPRLELTARLAANVASGKRRAQDLSNAFLLAVLFLGAYGAAACIPIADALKKIGATQCVTGKVERISQGLRGVQYIDFCAEHEKCPFTAVVFADHLRDVGDIRTLVGKTIEVHGQVREYDNHAEILVREARQLRGPGINLPPVPKDYDVEQRGRYSAGRFKARKQPSAHKRHKKSQLPPQGIEIPPDQPQ